MVSAPTTPVTSAAGTTRLGTVARLVASPYLLLVYAMILWSGNATVGRAFAFDIPPVTLSFWRWTIGFLILLPFTGRDVWRLRGVVLRHWRLLALYTVLGVAGCNILTYTALHDTTAVNSSLINSTTPIFVMCLSFAVFGDRIRRGQAIGVAVSLLGVLAIVSGGRLESLSALAINRGDLLMLGSIAMWSAYTALLRKKPEGLPPMAFLTVLLGIAVIVELPLYLGEYALVGGFAPTVPNLLAVLYVAIFPAVIALYFWNRAVAQLGANRVSPFVHLMPVFGTAMAVIFLGEIPGLHHAVGIALILTGVYLASLRRAPR
jgi:drug/metabolite transporter (DMT)-like permease